MTAGRRIDACGARWVLHRSAMNLAGELPIG
jgi:hypothetical protein